MFELNGIILFDLNHCCVVTSQQGEQDDQRRFPAHGLCFSVSQNQALKLVGLHEIAS